jgi:hypothetical protein
VSLARLLAGMSWLLALPLRLCVRLYQLLLSPWKGNTCRFEPSCSHYALQALAEHGAVHGSWLTVLRLCRCQPFAEPGFDPVPPRRR